MNALANPEVGKYLNEYFVSSYQKVATFKIVGKQKQGGNVASYFCTADGKVLHIVAGPVDAATLLREARWAIETYKMAALNPRAGLKEFMGKAHARRLWDNYKYDIRPGARWHHRPELDKQGLVHRLLALGPLPRVGEVYEYVFEKILREKISLAPVEES